MRAMNSITFTVLNVRRIGPFCTEPFIYALIFFENMHDICSGHIHCFLYFCVLQRVCIFQSVDCLKFHCILSVILCRTKCGTLHPKHDASHLSSAIGTDV